MLAALIGVAWVLMLATFALLGFVLVHFTKRIDELEDRIAELSSAQPVRPVARAVSPQRFKLEEEPAS